MTLAPDRAANPAADRADSLAVDVHASARAALDRAVAHLRALQDPAGWWKGELETNVTMDAEDLLLREFLGIRTADETAAAARWIRSQQRDDGSWTNYYGGPGDLSTTVEAWVALRLAGDEVDAPHLRAACDFVLANGGVERSRVFTRMWLALFGLWSWDDLPNLPPEIVYLPRWFPFNLYDWACWARQTIVPLTIVATLRPARPLPFGIDELRTGAGPDPLLPLRSWGGFFQRLDRVLHAYGRVTLRSRALGSLRRRAMRRGVRWILDRQEADGSWGGIQPPWVYSLLALRLSGHALDSAPMAAGLRGLDGFLVTETTPYGVVRRLEACQSPVWDTGLALTALLDAGVAADDPAVVQAADWLLGEEITVRGDWSVRRPRLEPGGWAFEFANDGYPDTDDTAEVVLGLRRVAHPAPARVRAAVDRGVRWTAGMQCRDGGWGAFDADNTRELAYKLPFCDFGAVVDPPSADVTAHVVEMLAAEGLAESPAARRGVRWLLDAQEPDGSWFGRWGCNYVYGIGAVVPALVAAGMSPADPSIRRAIDWLAAHQNDDGGWGEDMRSYDDPTWAGRGDSTASQTAWALLALLAAGERSVVADRGVLWLARTQRADGTWDEPQFTGTGFPGDFFINYHLYRLVFPISALGRYLALRRAGDHDTRQTGHGSGHQVSEVGGAVTELTVCTALRVESAAVRGPLRESSTRVIRTGMGPRRAGDSIRKLAGAGPVAMLGVAGGVAPTVQVGDVVVASEVRRGGVAVRCPSAPLLAGELRRAGLRVHLGPIATADSLLGKDALAALATTGALAIDMESAVVGAAAGGRPFVAVRVVTDTIADPLWRPDIVGRGWRALRTLRAVAPVVTAWAAAISDRTVHLAAPRSFCAGVERAIEIVERALDRYGAPIYVRRQIVHNAHIVGELQARGAVFVEELDEVPPGARVILAAHGVAPSVRAEAVARRLQVVDATCPLVAKVHAEVRRYAATDHTVFLIGHGDHEEVVGTVGEAPDRVVVVDDVAAASRADAADPDRVAYVMQTTLAVDEADEIAGVLRTRYPALVAPRQDDICYATSNRQLGVREIAGHCDVVLVVGSTNSSNSQRLVEVAERTGVPAYLVDDASDVRLDWIARARSIGITAGASAPPRLVDELVDCLGGLCPGGSGALDVHEHRTVTEDITFTLPREVS